MEKSKWPLTASLDTLCPAFLLPVHILLPKHSHTTEGDLESQTIRKTVEGTHTFRKTDSTKCPRGTGAVSHSARVAGICFLPTRVKGTQLHAAFYHQKSGGFLGCPSGIESYNQVPPGLASQQKQGECSVQRGQCSRNQVYLPGWDGTIPRIPTNRKWVYIPICLCL